jgi:hypothetical protein
MQVISLPMTGSLCMYSALFMRFAWMVQPRNYLLLSCHAFNESVQCFQLYRGYTYQEGLKKEASFREQADAGKPIPGVENFSAVGYGAFCASSLGLASVSGRLQQRLTDMKIMPQPVERLVLHPAGPFTIHFWAPTWKWMLSISNLLDFDRPIENVSTMQQTALTATGFIWTRYATVINPVNWNLFIVNVSLAATGSYQLARKLKHDFAGPVKSEEKAD